MSSYQAEYFRVFDFYWFEPFPWLDWSLTDQWHHPRTTIWTKLVLKTGAKPFGYTAVQCGPEFEGVLHHLANHYFEPEIGQHLPSTIISQSPLASVVELTWEGSTCSGCKRSGISPDSKLFRGSRLHRPGSSGRTSHRSRCSSDQNLSGQQRKLFCEKPGETMSPSIKI